MEVEFALDEADLVALARHHMEHSPAIRRRYRIRWIGVSLGIGLMGMLLYAFLSLKAPALYLGAFAAFFLVFYPYYYRWLVGRTLRKIVNARLNPKAFAVRTLRATPEGLELVSAGSKMAKRWDHISGVEVTLDRAFVAVDGEYTIVLPRRRLGDEPFQSLIETIRRFAELSSQKVA
ncbi:MAG: PH domain-containing protein [Deltaproteobacteria bacterium]|nr:PH domain-containing protein [Deltaproteobacteria bacterium]